MYLRFYRFREFPFAITCDPRFFFESPVHTEALANMMYTVQQRKGMVLITGEVGAGKTFVGSMLGPRLGLGCVTVMMKNPPQSAKQFLRAFASRVGLDPADEADKLRLLDRIEEHLIRLHQRRRLVALVLDECQDLPAAALEEIRLLWNWEHAGQRLVQIILIGQPELRDMLREPKWEPLRQRIVLSYHLRPLDEADTAAYVDHRLLVAGEDDCLARFTDGAVESIYRATDGIPRLINVLCDNALLVGYAKGAHEIDPPVVNEVLQDMTCWGLQTQDASAREAVETRSSAWETYGTR